jgi:hypothetical protein
MATALVERLAARRLHRSTSSADARIRLVEGNFPAKGMPAAVISESAPLGRSLFNCSFEKLPQLSLSIWQSTPTVGSAFVVCHLVQGFSDCMLTIASVGTVWPRKFVGWHRAALEGRRAPVLSFYHPFCSNLRLTLFA